MNIHLVGEISLSISSVIYFVWFIPQIWENFRRKSTEGLSLWMHGLLLLGYSIDLMYGFGRHMQWQYCAVTIVGLFFLFIQHYQFAHYDLKTRTEYWNFVVLSCLVAFALLFSILNITVFHHNKWYYDKAGYVESGCYFAYVIPQIIKNYRKKSAVGLSNWFVAFSISLSVLDLISALTLHWDRPSLLMPSIDMIKKLILVFQIMYYSKRFNATSGKLR